MRPILCQHDASRRPNDRVSHERHSADCVVLYTNVVGFPIQFACWPQATPFAGEACETNRLLAKTESCWKTHGTVLLHCLQPSRKFQHGT